VKSKETNKIDSEKKQNMDWSFTWLILCKEEKFLAKLVLLTLNSSHYEIEQS